MSNPPSQYVSTTRSPSVLEDFGNYHIGQHQSSYIYTIASRVAPRGVDVNTAIQFNTGQDEIAVPGGILPSEIMGARQYFGNGQVGPFIPNPGYRP